METTENPSLPQEIEWHKVITPILILGGQSSRMRTRKELLALPTGQPAYRHALTTLHSALPHARTIYISLHDASQAAAIPELQHPSPSVADVRNREQEMEHGHHELPPQYEALYDDGALGGVGPAAALLAAYERSSTTTYFIVGSGFPLLPPTGVQQLVLEYAPPLTCFTNAEGLVEPLVAIWGPEALAVLKRNVEEGEGSELSRVVELVGAKRVKPLREEWIKGVNTPGEWREVVEMMGE